MRLISWLKKSDTKNKLHEVIFEADTPKGKLFDVVLMILIISSVFTVMLETVESYDQSYHTLFKVLEWLFTIVFTIEYGLRLHVTNKPIKYATSFFGIIDLLAILPTFLGLFLAESGIESLLVIRALRLLRIFRVFKMMSFMHQGKIILVALKQSAPKIGVFVFFIMVVICIFGSIMYLVEGGVNPQFTSIPTSIYWTIVTMTTVGYGDISPVTPLGQFLAACIMITGYAIIAVPTGIGIASVMDKKAIPTNTQACRSCSLEGHEDDAVYCKFCGEVLNEPKLTS